MLVVRDAGDRQQAVEVQQQQLACSAAGAGEQHQDAHRLLVADSALLGCGAEQPGVTHDLRHRVIVEVDVLVRQPWRERLLARAPQPRMLISQRLPARLAKRACRLLLVVDHERVEPFDVIEDVAHGAVPDQLAAVRATARAALLDVPKELQRQQPQLGAIRAKARLIEPTLGDELAEDRQRAKPREHRCPAQKPSLKRGLQLPLDRLTQPWLLDHREVIAGARHRRLVIAQGDPTVEPWAPGVVLPPLARVVGDQQMPVAAPEDPGPELRPTELAAAARPLLDQLVLPLRNRAVDQRAQRRPPRAAEILSQVDEPVHQQGVGRSDRQPGVDHPPPAVGEVALHRLGQRTQIEPAPLRPAPQPPAKRWMVGERARRELHKAQLRRDLLPQLKVALLGVEAAPVQRLDQGSASNLLAHPSSSRPSVSAIARPCAARPPRTPTRRGSAWSGCPSVRGGG
jgi:hypothetical protein